MAHGPWPMAHAPGDEGWIASLALSRLSFVKAAFEYINCALLLHFISLSPFSMPHISCTLSVWLAIVL